MLPPLARLPTVPRLVDEKAYFVLHAPRQTGKTTTMIALAQELTVTGHYAAALRHHEVGAIFPDDPGAAELAILSDWRAWAAHTLPTVLQPPPWPATDPGGRIGAALGAWVRAIPRPLVIFLDEIDALQDDALIAVLRQLRAGYPRRPGAFPWSLALVGLRDVRDYQVAAGGGSRLGTASPFNIKIESLTLRDFTAIEVATLLRAGAPTPTPDGLPARGGWHARIERGPGDPGSSTPSRDRP